MSKKNKYVDIRSSGDSKNEFKVKSGVKLGGKKVNIELFNHENRKTTEYKYLKKDDYNNRAKITLEFVPDLGEGVENNQEVIEYSLTNTSPKSKTERDKLKKEAYANYIVSDVLAGDDKYYINDIQCEIRKGDNGMISLELSRQGDSRSPIRINNDKIEIGADFYLIEKITDEELVPYNSTEEKKPLFTKKTIIIFAILGIIAILMFVFRKKVWKWIKGETKQEKKVQDQLDIF